MEMATIDDIQRLQFSDLAGAEALTLQWLRNELGVDATTVSLKPKAVSLNSFNGFATIDGEELFFKSHVEPDSVIAEYYNAESLHDAGYNIVRPIKTVHESGQQIAFYPKITSPVVFDIMREIETATATMSADVVVTAERDECVRLRQAYVDGSSSVDAAKNSLAPVHQLFWHRLTGARYKNFYAGSQIVLPDGHDTCDWSMLLDAHVTVNGVEQARTLQQLIDEAKTVLDPAQDEIVAPGHGDAHYGNVFLEDGERFLYFDPAFGGRHSPVLDMVKPLFHNVFAQWMYFPADKATQLSTRVAVGPDRIDIEYGSYVPLVRQMILDIKHRELVQPNLDWAADQGVTNATRKFHLALMCCPLLTMNLTDAARFGPEVQWAGIAQALQMGNWDSEQNFAFDEAG